MIDRTRFKVELVKFADKTLGSLSYGVEFLMSKDDRVGKDKKVSESK
jgi:hypothetical protein